MNDSPSKWTLAQKRERHFYETRAASHEGRNEVYAEFHAPFWKAILNRLTELDFRDDGYYVDVGCGPNPIVAFVEHGNRIGVDPLMPFYQENFVLPEAFQPFEGTIEELTPIKDGQADVIFSMNNIDHIQNLDQAIATLRRKLRDDGFLVISVNVVGNPIAKLMAKAIDIYRVVDPTHTYHFHSPQEVRNRLAEHFDLVRYECIEQLSEEMQTRKNERDKQVKTLKGLVRQGLKFVKNDLILREKLHLFLFKPKSG
ncbi:MAG: methyltransferase domain-containing protein [Planctomycetes bacterium]|nr:methyltransferase domain-containing protein [Planctomycetota bacterium]